MVLAHAIHEMDGLQRDYIAPVYNIKDVATANKAQTSYDRDRGVMTMNLLDGGISWNEGFESGDFIVGDWVEVNGSETNAWIVGTGATNSGSYGAYISNDSDSYAYTNTSASTTHIYRDITFPKFLASDVYLDFYWKCDGEVGADYGRVSFYESTGATPTAGTELSTALNVGQSEYSNSTTYALETINLGAAGVLKDKTYRLVFSWENNGSVGSGPFAIDDLRLHFYVKNKEFQTTFLIDEDWESNSFTAHTWTLVNDSQNGWVVGTDNGTNHGTYSAYISDDGGTTASYTITNPEVSHLYIDFTIPSNAIDAELKFDWRSWAENAGGATNYDYGTVVIADTTTTPVAGTEVSTAVAASGGNGRIGATANDGKFNEGYGGSDANWRTETIDMSSYIGTTKRLIFTWKNDGSLGDDPPFTIDSIVFKYNSFI
jgi:hypothetical protein